MRRDLCEGPWRGLQRRKKKSLSTVVSASVAGFEILYLWVRAVAVVAWLLAL